MGSQNKTTTFISLKLCACLFFSIVQFQFCFVFFSVFFLVYHVASEPVTNNVVILYRLQKSESTPTSNLNFCEKLRKLFALHQRLHQIDKRIMVSDQVTFSTILRRRKKLLRAHHLSTLVCALYIYMYFLVNKYEAVCRLCNTLTHTHTPYRLIRTPKEYQLQSACFETNEHCYLERCYLSVVTFLTAYGSTASLLLFSICSFVHLLCAN